MKSAILLLMTSTLFACYSQPRTSRDAMVATHDLRTGALIGESDVRIIAVSLTLITPDIPRRRSHVLGHKTTRPIREGQFIHLSEVSQ
jgi:flagella basal body P-ring formation protein FlgA